MSFFLSEIGALCYDTNDTYTNYVSNYGYWQNHALLMYTITRLQGYALPGEWSTDRAN
jgi:hypothetical protein